MYFSATLWIFYVAHQAAYGTAQQGSLGEGTSHAPANNHGVCAHLHGQECAKTAEETLRKQLTAPKNEKFAF